MNQDRTISISTTYTLDTPVGMFSGLISSYEQAYERAWFATARFMERTERARQSLMALGAATATMFVLFGYSAVSHASSASVPTSTGPQMMASVQSTTLSA